jgi:hypothetical protein
MQRDAVDDFDSWLPAKTHGHEIDGMPHRREFLREPLDHSSAAASERRILVTRHEHS